MHPLERYTAITWPLLPTVLSDKDRRGLSIDEFMLIGENSGANEPIQCPGKILHYLDKINSLLSIGKTLVAAKMDLTNCCNNHCPACIGHNTGVD